MRCLLHQTKRLCARYLGCLQPRFTFLLSFSSSSFDKSRYKSTYRLLSTKPPDTTISKTKLPFTIDEKDIEESFTRGSGPGGQSVNKTQNKVRLVHIPTNISVYCHEERDLSTNRRIARRLLREKVELLLFGSQSKIAQRIEKLRERKQKASRRSKKKYHTDENESNSNLDIDVDLDTASDDNERND